jgi:hypothetical protein
MTTLHSLTKMDTRHVSMVSNLIKNFGVCLVAPLKRRNTDEIKRTSELLFKE